MDFSDALLCPDRLHVSYFVVRSKPFVWLGYFSKLFATCVFRFPCNKRYSVYHCLLAGCVECKFVGFFCFAVFADLCQPTFLISEATYYHHLLQGQPMYPNAVCFGHINLVHKWAWYWLSWSQVAMFRADPNNGGLVLWVLKTAVPTPALAAYDSCVRHRNIRFLCGGKKRLHAPGSNALTNRCRTACCLFL